MHVFDFGRQSASDPNQFQWAIGDERVVLTHDKHDFVSNNRSHFESGRYYPGIVIATFGTVREVVRGVVQLVEERESLENCIWYT